MKTTVEMVYKAYVALDAAKVSTLETAERQTVTSLWYALAEIGEKHKALIEKSNKNLMPDGYEGLALKGQYTTEEAVQLRRMRIEYERAVEAVVDPEAEKEVEVDIPQKLSRATIGKLIAENGWPMSAHRDLAIVIDPK
jgi:hypothetical protein